MVSVEPSKSLAPVADPGLAGGTVPQTQDWNGRPQRRQSLGVLHGHIAVWIGKGVWCFKVMVESSFKIGYSRIMIITVRLVDIRVSIWLSILMWLCSRSTAGACCSASDLRCSCNLPVMALDDISRIPVALELLVYVVWGSWPMAPATRICSSHESPPSKPLFAELWVARATESWPQRVAHLGISSRVHGRPL